MEQYTIYCTEKQTNKALELGAPIDVDFQFNSKTVIINNKAYIVPTAEQMIGWLEEQGVFNINIGYTWKWSYGINDGEITGGYETRKEATLAAISSSLEYLSKNNEL